MQYTIEQYNRAFKQICEDFITVYYEYGPDDRADYYIIGEGGRLAPDTIEVNDMYWSISNMYEALKNDIPRDKLMEWYDYALNKHTIEESPVNLTSYALGVKEYTEEERKQDEERIAESFRLLQEAINATNKNKRHIPKSKQK